jgi:hypothetical protein
MAIASAVSLPDSAAEKFPAAVSLNYFSPSCFASVMEGKERTARFPVTRNASR